MMKSSDLKIKIFADGANMASILSLNNNPIIQGFTTNPTLMNKAGISDYEQFAKDIIHYIPDKPFSFEVFADDFSEMYRQAKKIASFGSNVYVKIPITNTKGESSIALVERLSHEGVKLNVTAIFTLKQASQTVQALINGAPSVVSIFAGRIADAGVNPTPLMMAAKSLCAQDKNIELLWASPRELYNIIEADGAGCDIITVGHDLLAKINLFGKDLEEFSLDTVKMFRDDSVKAGYVI